MDFPQINNEIIKLESLKLDDRLFNTRYGNLETKIWKITYRIDFINHAIQQVFSTYIEPAKAEDMSIEERYNAKLSNKGIFRRMCEGKYGKYLTKNLINLPNHYIGLLLSLNEVSNAYKHSFINSDNNLIGKKYPTIVALALNQNNLSNTPKFHSINFREFIEQFSEFYKYSMDLIKDITQRSVTTFALHELPVA